MSENFSEIKSKELAEMIGAVVKSAAPQIAPGASLTLNVFIASGGGATINAYGGKEQYVGNATRIMVQVLSPPPEPVQQSTPSS